MAEKEPEVLCSYSYIKTPVKATAEILNKAEANMKHKRGFIKGTLPLFTVTHMPLKLHLVENGS